MSGIEQRLSQSRDDLRHGEMVIIAARWVLVTAGLVLALWNPAGVVQLQIAIVVILGLAMGNFALHLQVLTQGSLMRPIVYTASVADLAAISLLIVAGGGVPAAPYVFYLPALLAIAVTFRTEVTALYAAGAVASYAVIALATADPIAVMPLAIEVLMLVAVPTCGNVYWRLERDERRRVRARDPEPIAPHRRAG